MPAAQEALLRRMYDVFATDERDAFVPHCLAPDVDWPNMLDGGRCTDVRRYGRTGHGSSRRGIPSYGWRG
ncbi:hypothetical protein OHV08_19705 [Streptomyces canus]|uniref:hypothetical protein n=1 Tax=Streptomyces canus TaxID=58343 RepID=UPI00325592BC